jgi:hypothetical protein
MGRGKSNAAQTRISFQWLDHNNAKQSHKALNVSAKSEDQCSQLEEKCYPCQEWLPKQPR